MLKRGCLELGLTDVRRLLHQTATNYMYYFDKYSTYMRPDHFFMSKQRSLIDATALLGPFSKGKLKKKKKKSINDEIKLNDTGKKNE